MWRKALQICRKLRVLFFSVIAVSAGSMIFAQSGIGGITAPSMPTVSAPTLSDDFFDTHRQRQVQKPKSGKSGCEKNSPSEKADEKTCAEKSQSSSSTVSTLTASDIKTLNVSGVLGNLLDGNAGLASSTLSNVAASSTNSETNKLLNKVLSEMEEIKKQGGVEAETVRSSIQAPVVTSTVAQSKQSRLIRFNVNGYDVLRTCRTVYISDVQADGTFLVTGDSRYLSDGVTRSETFHLLFKTDADSAGRQNYHAAAAVTQDYMNQYSFLYQLAQRNDLSALRTGNLVTMRTTDPDWKLELLIDLGESK